SSKDNCYYFLDYDLSDCSEGETVNVEVFKDGFSGEHAYWTYGVIRNGHVIGNIRYLAELRGINDEDIHEGENSIVVDLDEDRLGVDTDKPVDDSRSGGNPSYTETVNYITQQCKEIGLPVDIGLAIAWTESGMTQFNEDGIAKKNENKRKDGKVVSVDWGIMQLNDKSWSNEYDFDRIKTDWKYNVRCGLAVALNRYKEVIRLGEENIPRATYSGYNSWSNIDRYRTEKDQRDINFEDYYTNKPWEELIDSNLQHDIDEDFEYCMGTEQERIEYVFGKDTKLWDDVYQTKSEAKKHMKTVEVKIWKYDEKTKTKVPGIKSITINEKLADVIVKIFDEIYNDPEQFPIDWDTAAFNWRGDGSKSMHNQGLAVDINWEKNALVSNDGKIMAGKLYKPGENIYSIPKSSSVVRAFKKYGWYWGGDWESKKDYMHFSYLNR
ncbi:MAG: M15 family metallopeptidase, partial [Clostridia bacterium]|nr:M15 family metallopeptidase [Clostridia bacterium]